MKSSVRYGLNWTSTWRHGEAEGGGGVIEREIDVRVCFRNHRQLLKRLPKFIVLCPFCSVCVGVFCSVCVGVFCSVLMCFAVCVLVCFAVGVLVCFACVCFAMCVLVSTCEADLLVAEQAEDAVVELELPAVALVHLSQDAHQLAARLGGVAALALVGRQLVERPLPRAANPLVLALRHPGNDTGSLGLGN